MKRNNISIVFSLMLLSLVSACTEQMDFSQKNRRITVDAVIADNETRAVLTQESGTLNLISRWREGETVNLIFIQDGVGYKATSEPVGNFSADGKSCSFTFYLPGGLYPDRPYDVFGLCWVDGEAIAEEGKAYAKSEMWRRPFYNDGVAPLWFHKKTTGMESFLADFKHLGTYEVLHVQNNTDTRIDFNHRGFDVQVPWFKYEELTMLDDNYDPTQYVTEPGDTESGYVLIEPHETGSILSWYIPSGALINEAKLLAKINGSDAVTTNTISSSVQIQRGHAYHMYVTWDGGELKFGKGDIDENSTIILEPTEIDFGEAAIGETKSEFLTIINCGEEQAEVKVSIEGTNNIFTENFEIVDAELGDNFFIKNIPPGGYYNAEIHFRASAVEDYCGKLVITSDGIQGGSYVVPLKGKGIEEDKSFHLSANSIEMYVNTEELVMILNGSGEYEVTNENPAIVDYDINGTHVAQSPRRGDGTTGGQMSDDCWWITAKKVGNATLRLKDKITNEVLTLKVKVISSSNLSCPDNHHPHMIDLGLPSGTLWACCNVGASKPEDYGGYYAWGETSSKDVYNSSTYIHCDGSEYTCHDIGTDISGTRYDAATANWGAPWQMPTQTQCEELHEKCTSEWTIQNGINGRIFKGPNGGTIFLPSGGYYLNEKMERQGQFGMYWSSSPVVPSSIFAYTLNFASDFVNCSQYSRIGGRSVRPVKNSGNTSVSEGDELK